MQQLRIELTRNPCGNFGAQSSDTWPPSIPHERNVRDGFGESSRWNKGKINLRLLISHREIETCDLCILSYR